MINNWIKEIKILYLVIRFFHNKSSKKCEIEERQIRKKEIGEQSTNNVYSHDLINKYPSIIYVC